MSGPDCIPVVVLKNCDPEPCWKESYSPDCLKVSMVVPVSRSTAELLTVVSDRIDSTFNRSGAALFAAVDISKSFKRVWHATSQT